MPEKKPIRILAVDPGTRYMGVAVFEDKDLIYSTVKIVKEKKMSSSMVLKKAEGIISSLIEDYDPHILVVEKTFFVQSKRSSLLNVLTDEMKILGKKKGLRVYAYAPTTVRKFVCQNGKATKMKTALMIATEYYPWLYRYYEKDTKKQWWEERYWANMFDAIALGLTCYHNDVDRKIRRKAN